VPGADLQGTLAAVLSHAVDLIDGAGAAGLNLFEKGSFVPQVVLGEAPPVLDALQQSTGVGPCIEASRDQRTVEIVDTRLDSRWPPFCSRATDLNVLSMLCVPLWVDDRRLGSLSLYASDSGAFNPVSQRLAGLFATHAALALADTQRDADLRRMAASRDLIGQAKGIVMATQKVDADAAFAMLVAASQHLNIKIIDIATAVATSGQLPAR
jgi:GAF domain-containing protein